jgi:antitoxin VapB
MPKTKDENRLAVKSTRERGLIALLKAMKPLNEPFPEIDDPAPGPAKQSGEPSLSR